MKTNLFAAFLGSILFMSGFALATGVDQNPVQAFYACALIALSCFAFRYAERHVRETSTDARKRKAAKAA